MSDESDSYEYGEAMDMAEDEIAELREENREMLEELRALEWSGSETAHGEPRAICPDCGAVEGVPAMRFYRTHAPDCELGALLAKHNNKP